MTTPSFCALAGLFLFAGSFPLQAQVTFVPQGSTWKYLDNGTNQGTAWQAAAFDDSSWAQGAGQLGYGDGDEATVVSYGPDAALKYITTYFRKSFTVADAAAVGGLKLELLRDDGAVVYLNGVEVARSNMPGGTVTSATLASAAVSGADETTTFYSFTLSPAQLVTGTNVLAVEVHQSAANSSDLSFDLRLNDGVAVPSLVRGPYIQSVATTGATLRWRTNLAGSSVVRYGLTPDNLDQEVSVADAVTEHEVTLTGLTANTRYYYSAGSSTGVLAQSTDHYFETHPVAGTAKNTRLWVLGDSGTGNANALAVRNAFYAYNGNSAHTDLLLMLGDNAYNSGTDTEYTSTLFNIYPNTLRNTPLWPTLGNHDATSASSSAQSGPYYDAFTLPKTGGSGGLASGTEAYYSFDYANMHIISIDSQDTSRSATGAMYQWLKSDLEATSQEWIIAFFHHPPYTKGTHNSDDAADSSGRMRDMRAIFLPLLEDNGVDLILCGHSHVYERSFLLDGHYDVSSTFNAASMVKDASSGNAVSGGTGPYVKLPVPHDGTVYSVVGSSGQAGSFGSYGAPVYHPAMYVSLSQLGSMVLDVNGNLLQAKFINSSGAVTDQFGIRHEEVPAVPAGLAATAGDGQVVLDWDDNTEADLAGYRVLRSTSSGTGFTQVADVAASTWTDSGRTNGTTYYYRIKAYDTAGYESGLTASAQATPQDTTPPAPPSGVTAVAASASVTLDWADNTEADLAFYRVYRSQTSGSGFTLLAAAGSSVWIDNTAQNGVTWFYLIRAVDASGNESAASAQVSATPAALAPSVWVQDIAMGLTGNRGKYKASAAVLVRKTGGTAVSGATVTGQWKLNGTVIARVSGKTAGSGLVTLTSPQISAAAGSVFNFTVTGVTASGLTYNTGLNVETSDSITVP